ncbi:myoferlin-like isoform X1 [Dendronephthya gigantea]|uniref:myoferlin-like isoform X1 n=1 Tax=Dendronephthya gigantea TaxID=151771 RepID=UPI00106CF17B|nr:myoferlin-like isoform X1 [Dendronephthya gigantea]
MARLIASTITIKDLLTSEAKTDGEPSEEKEKERRESLGGSIDPYVSMKFKGITKKTEVIHDELNPVWNEAFEWDLQGRALVPEDNLVVQVKDWERVGRNRLLGTATISLRDLVRDDCNSMQADVNLLDGNQRTTQAKLSMQLEYIPPEAQKDAKGENAEDKDAEGEEEEQETGIEGASGKGRRKIRTARYQLSDKPQDFQIRIKVIEGRQLTGLNIHPVVRVSVSNQARQTRVKRSTNKPYYNEIFFFNFQMVPSELFDEIITFEVFNSRKLRANAMIGFFKLDVGMVYDEPEHAVSRKWILLTDPEDKMSGVKGYLKTSICVLGPGDRAPSMEDVDAADESTEDVESNLLCPAGVMLRPGMFSLKVYRAEDIPQMDSGFAQGIKRILNVGEEQKELVDPYLVFSFAGKKRKTRTHYNSDHPEFNQELHLPFKFPSMCERLRLRMMDWDRLTKDDCIGTVHLPLSQISGQGGDGFLPTFGPCFINFYGSTREYSDLPDEHDELNMGQGEGVAYRGRLLVELESALDCKIDEPVEDIQSTDIVRIQSFLRRRKFKLFACFLEALMISIQDSPVEFEVSIGNYGNKLDKSVAPSSSTTPPTNAIFDGCYYYYLPWGNTKPCISVDSHWEDISFRLDPLNVLLKLSEKLEMNMEKVTLSLESNDSTAETAILLIALLDELIAECKKPLPSINAKTPGVNELDLHLHEARVLEMISISEEAAKLRECATDISEALSEINGFLIRLKDIAIEPQNSLPDVIIWMLSGSKRVAYYRIPAYKLLFSKNSAAKGKYCGEELDVILKYPGKKGKNIEDFPEVPAYLRVMIWFGLEEDQMDWTKRDDVEGDFSVFAETYENQICVLGSWTSKGCPRPSFSNARGDVALPKTCFNPPEGWQWEDDWFIDPELSLCYDRDTGHKSFLEDAFENESRVPGTAWQPAVPAWTDVKSDAITPRQEIQCPKGWVWTSEWKIDLNRAVDEEGWEYTVEATLATYGPVEKVYHLCRRRRWIRERKFVKDSKKESDTKSKEVSKEGWEYSTVFTTRFHATNRKMDLVRRRRWHRKMTQMIPSAPAVFLITSQEGKDHAPMLNAPRMFITFEKPHKYQLRAYVYQARDMIPSDSSGLSDPYVRVSFGNSSQATEILMQTLCPTWDQTLIFENVPIYGNIEGVQGDPPHVVLEFFDRDAVGKDEYIGRTIVKPTVKLNGSQPPSPQLLWYDITKGDEDAGEMLAAFELFLDEGADLPFAPPLRNELYLVPSGVRPVLQRTAIEVLCWGVRNMKKYQLATVSSPSIEFEVGGHIIESTVIMNTAKNPNFDDPLFFFDIYLPREELYMPPMNIKVRDNRSFGRKPVVGLCSLKSLHHHRREPRDQIDAPDSQEGHIPPKSGAHALEIKEEKKRKKHDSEEDLDWWSKYYASTGELAKSGNYLEKGYDKIKIYPSELEECDGFERFEDFVQTFTIRRGKNRTREESDEHTVGEFKGTFRVYPLPNNPKDPLPPKYLHHLPPSCPVECIVRVYVIKGIDLQPMDANGLADPYLVVKLGKQKINDREKYVPNSLNPLFGRMFELTATLPIHKDLCVRVMDYDLISHDDVIGETVIDLENRFLSSHRGTCGLPETYCLSGPNQWRDCRTPKELLAEWCENQSLCKPHYIGNTQVIIDQQTHTLSAFERGLVIHSHMGAPDQRLALHVLNSLNVFVPEHVETRRLYNRIQPNIEQGKLQLFVDIFPKHLGTPGPPFNISPRNPSSYELRIIVWNTSDVILDETSITGEQMSDIYVKCWVAGINEKQRTDVHYRSLDGEGNFNWRMVFPFDYLAAEKIMVVKKKSHFWSLDSTEERLPPTLVVQVWDNDSFSPDDFLGAAELNLDHLTKPAKKASKCGLHQLPDLEDAKFLSSQKEEVSLFEQKRMYGWWPVVGEEGDERILAGKVEMSLELLTAEESALKPAGLGRNDPNANPALEEPHRPATSFRWFTSPWKSMRYIIWRNYKWYIIGFILLVLILLVIGIFFYSMPGYSVKKIFKV